MLGAPLGASTPFGKSGTEPFTVRSILPLNGGSSLGRISCPAAGSANDAASPKQTAPRTPIAQVRFMIGPLSNGLVASRKNPIGRQAMIEGRARGRRQQLMSGASLLVARQTCNTTGINRILRPKTLLSSSELTLDATPS